MTTSGTLNPEQRRAVKATSGPVLVIAGPGTGKTRVVTHRIANQVAEGVAGPANILAVTFTDKAAAEMQARLRAMGVPAGGRGGVRAATFHSAALRQVRYFWPRSTGGQPPQVLGSKLGMLNRLLRDRSGPARGPGMDAIDLANEIEWVKAQGARVDGASMAPGPDTVEAAGSDISRAGPTAGVGRLAELELDGPAPRWRLDRDAYRRALEVHDGPWPADLDPDVAVDTFAAIFKRYEADKSRASRIDFEDILAADAALLATDTEVATTVRGQYTHLTVDEFQDVNRLQWDLLATWLGDRDEVCVVGDGDQAIYGFAGASPAYLEAFRARWPAAEVVRLTRNYRSSQAILDLAAAALDDDREPLSAMSSSPSSDQLEPRLVACADGEAERDRVVARCRRLAGAGIDWQEMAVLYRFNAQSEAWEEAFATAGIPYRVRGDEPFFARQHVERALRVLRASQRAGEGEVQTDDPLVELDGAEPRRPPLGRVVRRVLRRRMSWTDDPPEGDHARERWADLNVLVELADELGDDGNVDSDDEPVGSTGGQPAGGGQPAATLAGYLADLDRRAQLGRDPDGGGVNLMTLHRAKGLEFDAVFIVACEEGCVPSRYAVADDERAETGDDQTAGRSAVAEERRLFYVGLTRARCHLHVTWKTSGSKRPSRFLFGLPGGPSRGSSGTKSASSASSGAKNDDAPLSEAEQERFEKLREWRLQRSMTDGVPAFVVFHDSVLRDVARQMPADRDQLLAVDGVGPTKLDRYGEAVLDLVDELDGGDVAERTTSSG